MTNLAVKGVDGVPEDDLQSCPLVSACIQMHVDEHAPTHGDIHTLKHIVVL